MAELETPSKKEAIEKVWVIGGSSIYKVAYGIMDLLNTQLLMHVSNVHF